MSTKTVTIPVVVVNGNDKTDGNAMASVEKKPEVDGKTVAEVKVLTAAEDGNKTMAVPETAPQQPSPKVDEDMIDPACDPRHPQNIQFSDISSAAFNIRDGIILTPCNKSPQLSSLFGLELYLKKEFMQVTGSFKERGARYALLNLTEKQRKAGAIAASAGNHALALAYHGQQLGIPITVIMPVFAPLMKVSSCRNYGANVIQMGQNIQQCKEYGFKYSREHGMTYINGFDHPDVVAGQGTIGLEILDQVSKVDAVIVPVGGGGLIAGVAKAVKTLRPQVLVIGVEAETCPSFVNAMENTHFPLDPESSLADGLAVPTVGANAVCIAHGLVDKLVTVCEESIALAILRLLEMEKSVVEGAGAVGLAALISGKLPFLKGKKVVNILTGGNIDTTVLGRTIERGLAVDGRLIKFDVVVSDRPGGIAELATTIAKQGASIKDIFHERAWVAANIYSVRVKVICETRDHHHAEEFFKVMAAKYSQRARTWLDHQKLAAMVEYGVAVTNKFCMLSDDEGADPSQILEKAAQIKKQKTAVVKPASVAPPATTLKKPERTTTVSNKENEGATRGRGSARGRGQRREGGDRERREGRDRERREYGDRERREGGDRERREGGDRERREGGDRERREGGERERREGERGRGRGGNRGERRPRPVRENPTDAEVPVEGEERPEGEKPYRGGRGGRGGVRRGGARGDRQNRSGMMHDNSQHVKREGHGVGNWGTVADELKGETEPLEQETEKPTENGEIIEVEKEEEKPIGITLAEWKKLHEAENTQAFDVRQPRIDKKLNLVAFKREDDDEKDADDEDDEPAQNEPKKKTVDIAVNFNTGRSYGRGDRGDRRGRGGNFNNRGGDRPKRQGNRNNQGFSLSNEAFPALS